MLIAVWLGRFFKDERFDPEEQNDLFGQGLRALIMFQFGLATFRLPTQ
jgi:hypothetical protein